MRSSPSVSQVIKELFL